MATSERFRIRQLFVNLVYNNISKPGADNLTKLIGDKAIWLRHIEII